MVDSYEGLAILISSVTASFVALGTYVRQGRVLRASQRHDETLAKLSMTTAKLSETADQTHALVNGQSLRLNAAIEKGAFAAGEKAGAEAERANPLVSERV